MLALKLVHVCKWGPWKQFVASAQLEENMMTTNYGNISNDFSYDILYEMGLTTNPLELLFLLL